MISNCFQILENPRISKDFQVLSVILQVIKIMFLLTKLKVERRSSPVCGAATNSEAHELNSASARLVAVLLLFTKVAPCAPPQSARNASLVTLHS